jgi:hypothetical protein
VLKLRIRQVLGVLGQRLHALHIWDLPIEHWRDCVRQLPSRVVLREQWLGRFIKLHKLLCWSLLFGNRSDVVQLVCARSVLVNLWRDFVLELSSGHVSRCLWAGSLPKLSKWYLFCGERRDVSIELH